MTTLISFLGKGQDGCGYREANYLFDDNQCIEKQKYIGLALAKKIRPNRLILLGTSGSMWDVFLESGSDGLENEWVNLSDSVQSQNVTQNQLQHFESYLSEKLETPTQCILIPFAKNTTEQIEILSVLANALQDQEQVILDVTNGFRHLPMLALVAARFLKTIKKIDVQHIYYGALDMTQDEQTPVLKLDGLLDLLDWTDALTTFDKDGDYSVFSQLLEKEGLQQANITELKQAAFYERITNSSQASQKLSTLMSKIEQFNSPIFDLFKQQLLGRIQWFKKGNRGKQEQQLAKEYLQRRDYLRAVIFLIEGKISSALLSTGGDVNNHTVRKDKATVLDQGNDYFEKLRWLRNALAHGTRSNDSEVLKALNDEENIQSRLGQDFKHLLD